MTGDQLRRAIKLAGITIDACADLLKISRQTLYIHLKKAELDPGFVEEVKSVLLPKIKKRDPTNDSLQNLFITPETGQASEIRQLKETIAAQKKTIDLQEKLILQLENQLEMNKDFSEGKAGARRTSG